MNLVLWVGEGVDSLTDWFANCHGVKLSVEGAGELSEEDGLFPFGFSIPIAAGSHHGLDYSSAWPLKGMAARNS
jgi:hypothetical protein